ncbi:alpha/beta fold hydrolase [Paraburkholderia sp. BL25I1N1]|uniref:alpha/beta fold hydrolase n=1 Tax=Paraburkholderia sp. BL25I1N1 TaxID=1938804 RepID=UPI000D064F92|nr:alpha/beta hydrolase [Paraburkholderia sp. BL25I1N1]PRY04483.1 pimeloyl-ACP methyl ester carboxylesterase [Paraburkholderia sp. BL25I1N1]
MKTSLYKILALIFCGASILGGVAGCGSSRASTSATVVLVHGAWADGSSWASVTPFLQKQGLKVVAVQLPRTSLSDDAAVVSRAVNAQSGAVILVGHSYGGAVITEAGNSPKVAALVYVSAFSPGEGQSINDLTSPFPKPAWESGLIVDEAGYLTLSNDTFLNSFGPDVPRDTATVLASAQGPLLARCLDDKVTTAAWKTKPSWWVYGDQDQIIPPALQQAEAKQLGARITSIPGASHLALVTHADAVAQTILRRHVDWQSLETPTVGAILDVLGRARG